MIKKRDTRRPATRAQEGAVDKEVSGLTRSLQLRAQCPMTDNPGEKEGRTLTFANTKGCSPEKYPRDRGKPGGARTKGEGSQGRDIRAKAKWHVHVIPHQTTKPGFQEVPKLHLLGRLPRDATKRRKQPGTGHPCESQEGTYM